MDPFVQQLAQLLSGILGQDNQHRQQCETTLDQLKQNPQQLAVGLLTLLRQWQDSAVRSLAAVLIRINFGSGSKSLWMNTPVDVQATIKQQLLESLTTEAEAGIRSNTCHCISEIFAHLHSKNIGQWPELVPWLFSNVQHQQPGIRESAFEILSGLSPYLYSMLRGEHFQTLRTTLFQGLNDQQGAVKLSALAAVVSYIKFMNTPQEWAQFQELTEAMLQVISASLNAQNEDDAQKGLRLFSEIAEEDPAFLRPYLPLVMEAMLRITSAPTLETDTRQLSLEFLISLCESKPAMVRKMPKFTELIVPLLLGFMSSIEEEDLAEWNQEDDDEDESSLSSIGEQALDRVAMSIKGKQLIPILLDKIPQMLQSDHWQHRHAAIMAVSTCGEGCVKIMSPVLEDIVKLIVKYLVSDPHPRVRWAACNCLGQMSSDFGPDEDFQLKYHHIVIPGLMTIMEQDQANPRVRSHSAAAIVNFCEFCDADTISPHLPTLLPRLVTLISDGPRIVQEQAVTAIAAVADAAEDKFTGYYDTLMPILKTLLSNANGKEYRMLRGKCFECISLIGVAVGAQKFLPDAQQVLEAMLHTHHAPMDDDDPQSTFLLQSYGRICQCLGVHFAPYLQHIMPVLLAKAAIKPDVKVQDALGGVSAGEDNYEWCTVGDKRIGVRTSGLEEKQTAFALLFVIVRELKEHFFPYLAQTCEIAIPMIQFYYHDDVRMTSYSLMPYLLICASSYAKFKNENEQAYTLPIFMQIFQELIQALGESDSDFEMVTPMLECLGECIVAAGTNCLQQDLHIQAVVEICLQIMKEVAERRNERRIAQQDQDHDEEAEEDLIELNSGDDDMVCAVAEVLGRIARTHPSFINFIPNFLPVFEQMLRPEHSAIDRQSALCIFDDICEFLGAAGIQFLHSFVEPMFTYALDTDPGVRQAATYGIGVFGVAISQTEQAQNKELTNALVTRLTQAIVQEGSREGVVATATDNAIGAFGKLLGCGIADPAQYMKLWLSWLPVRQDPLESYCTYDTLIKFIESSNPHVLGENGSNIPHLIKIIAQVIDTNLTNEDNKTRMVKIVQHFNQQFPQVFDSIRGELNPTHYEALQTAVMHGTVPSLSTLS